jgi:hypothetical protein
MMHDRFSSLKHIDSAMLPVLAPWNITQTHITRHCERCITDADTRAAPVLSWASCSRHCLMRQRTVLETDKCWWDAFPEIDRTRGLTVAETRTPTSDSWRCVNDVLGGPGRNRTTDTRIFKLQVSDVRTAQGFAALYDPNRRMEPIGFRSVRSDFAGFDIG